VKKKSINTVGGPKGREFKLQRTLHQLHFKNTEKEKIDINAVGGQWAGKENSILKA
jgi:hypothetical protein